MTGLSFLDFFRKHYKKELIENELKDITELDLSENSIVNLPSDLLGHCVNLHTLNLSFNELVEVPSSLLENCVNLTSLNLSNNKLTAIESNTFENLVNLTALDLSDNNLIEIKPETFKNLIKLTDLNLRENKQLKTVERNFQFTPNLEVLDISNCCFSELPFEIIFLENLIEFYYKKNPIYEPHRDCVDLFLLKHDFISC